MDETVTSLDVLTTSYSVSKQGVSGSDGKGIISTVITYQAVHLAPLSRQHMVETIPSVSENHFCGRVCNNLYR